MGWNFDFSGMIAAFEMAVVMQVEIYQEDEWARLNPKTQLGREDVVILGMPANGSQINLFLNQDIARWTTQGYSNLMIELKVLLDNTNELTPSLEAADFFVWIQRCRSCPIF
jgi:hypothetical protein